MSPASTPLQTHSEVVLTNPATFAEDGWQMLHLPTLLNDRAWSEAVARLQGYVSSVPELTARPPRPYQLHYAALGILRPENFFAYEQGTGKTYVAALMIMGLYGRDLSGLAPGTIHILAPRHVLNSVWLKKELAKAGLAQWAQVIDGERTARLSRAPIWIYHYDLLNLQTEHGRKKGRKEPLHKLFRRRFGPGLLVIDEIHRLKTGTERTHAVGELRKRAKRVLGLTGTPMDGWVEHLACILGIIYRENSPAFPYSVTRFTKTFTRTELNTRDFVTGQDDSKAARKRPAPGIAVDRLSQFYKDTRHLIHRLTFKDPEVSNHVHFPAVDHQVVKVGMDDDHAAYYQQVHADVLKRITDAIRQMDAGHVSRSATRTNVLTHLNTLRAAANHPWEVPGFTPLAATQTRKMQKLLELVQQYTQQGRKVIVYTNRIAVGNRLEKLLTAAKIQTTRIYADDPQARPKKLSQKDREDRIEKFQEDAKLQVMIGNLELISEGLTLVEASVVIHHDHDWKSITWSQGNNRVVRPGQSHDPVPVFDLLLDRTVDCYVHTAMLRKAVATLQTIDRQFDSFESAVVDPIEVARTLVRTEEPNNVSQSDHGKSR